MYILVPPFEAGATPIKLVYLDAGRSSDRTESINNEISKHNKRLTMRYLNIII